MPNGNRTIEIDAHTADLIEQRASEHGISVSQLLTDLIGNADGSASDDEESVVELERRWAGIESGDATVPHDEVVRWLKTWGKPTFRPWRRS